VRQPILNSQFSIQPPGAKGTFLPDALVVDAAAGAGDLRLFHFDTEVFLYEIDGGEYR
jgi:hypothetical protein